MNEYQDANDLVVTRIVRGFRSLASRAAADPLRLLPPDPLAPLAALGAGVAEITAASPFVRLRAALAAPDASPGGRIARARVQRLPTNVVGPTRPRPRVGPAAGARPAHAMAAHDRPAPASHGAGASPATGETARPREATAGPPASLAERRAALRRHLHPSEGRTVTIAPVAAATRPASGDMVEAPRLRNALRITPIPGDFAAEPSAAARLLSPSNDAPAVEGSGLLADPGPPLTPAAATALAGRAPRGGAELEHSGALPARSAAARPGTGGNAASPVASGAPRGIATSLDHAAGAAEAPRRSPIPRSGVSVSPDDASRARRVDEDPLWNPDDLFDALYRDGVDLTWP